MKGLFNTNMLSGPSLRGSDSDRGNLKNRIASPSARNDNKLVCIKNRGQSIAEYIIIFAVILAAVFATGIIDRLRNSFNGYCDAAINRLR